ALERQIAAAWGRGFKQDNLSVEADFFLDLGGHSLFAALVVSDLRRSPALQHLAIADLYSHPTIRGLARHLDGQAKTSGAAGGAARRTPAAWQSARPGVRGGAGDAAVPAVPARRPAGGAAGGRHARRGADHRRGAGGPGVARGQPGAAGGPEMAARRPAATGTL